ncbi:hypothetical protein Tco_1057574 [Tanacetum coccineum]|uniref:Uncharacterized protein n=1 Tax=Tanacetum coccineum TaxID=301880 RepID=A0ABQ5H7K6_9ASTR
MPVMPPSSTYKVGSPSIAAAEGPSLTLLAPGVPVPPSVIEDLCTCMGNLEYGHGLIVKKVITVSDAEVADSIAIGKIGPRVSNVEDQMHVMASQMVQVVSGLEQGQQATTQRDEMIAGLRRARKIAMQGGEVWRALEKVRLVWGDKEVTIQYLELKGGDRGACKLLGDMVVMS